MKKELIFQSKNDEKSMNKWVAAPFLAKIEKITALGCQFSLKIEFLVDSRVPGVSLAEVLRRVSDRKFWNAKKDGKKVRKVVASAGDADPGQGGFWEDRTGQV